MKVFLLVIAALMSAPSNATSDKDVENYCLDFGMLIGALVIDKAKNKPLDLNEIVVRGKSIGESYGSPNFQSWASDFSTLVVRKISNMPYSEIAETYNQNGGELVRLTSVFKQVCHSQIK